MILTSETFRFVYNHHRAIRQVGNALAWVTADTNDFDAEMIAWQIFTAQALREVINIDGINFFRGCYFNQVEVIG